MDQTFYLGTYSPSASRISQLLKEMGLEKYNDNKRNGGYRCTQWFDDNKGEKSVRIDYLGVRKDMGIGRFAEFKIRDSHRNKLKEIRDWLMERGVLVIWGFDPETSEPDTTFLVVLAKTEENIRLVKGEVQEEAPEVRIPEQATGGPKEISARLNGLMITLPQAEEGAREVARAHQAGKDEAARRLEYHLMRAVLVAIVSGAEDQVDLAACALSAQNLYFPR